MFSFIIYSVIESKQQDNAIYNYFCIRFLEMLFE